MPTPLEYLQKPQTGRLLPWWFLIARFACNPQTAVLPRLPNCLTSFWFKAETRSARSGRRFSSRPRTFSRRRHAARPARLKPFWISIPRGGVCGCRLPVWPAFGFSLSRVSDMTSTNAPVPARKPGASSFYAIAWRWHFYAGLYVVPFLVMLALTGLVMVFFTGFQTRLGMTPYVTPAHQVQAVTVQAQAALAHLPGATLKEYIAPKAPDVASWFVLNHAGSTQAVAVDPYTAQVLKAVDKENTVFAWAEKIHGTLLLGEGGERFILDGFLGRQVCATLGHLPGRQVGCCAHFHPNPCFAQHRGPARGALGPGANGAAGVWLASRHPRRGGG
jgi:hypothetical protein